jgi:hypothetical protein
MAFRRSFSGLVLFLCALPLFAAPATVTGTLTVNGTTTKLTHVYAAKRTSPFDKTKPATFVIATDTELPQTALIDDMEFMKATMKMPLSGVEWLIDSGDQNVVSLVIHSPNLKKLDQFSSVGSQKLELTANTPARVAGHLFLPKPDDFFENMYQFDIHFDVPVSDVKAPDPVASLKGTRLPAGGGEPGQAYSAYRRVLIAGNIPALKKSVAKERQRDFDDPDFSKMFPVIQAMQPKNVKITAGSIDGDTATLLAEAKDEHETSTGTITLVREAGMWKVSKENWSSKIE